MPVIVSYEVTPQLHQLKTIVTCKHFLLRLFLSDLPAGAPLTDLSKLADLDMSKLPKTEESGDRCVRRIQEFLINEMPSAECGILPEDKLQRLMVGVSFFFIQTRVCDFSSFSFVQTRVRFSYELIHFRLSTN